LLEENVLEYFIGKNPRWRILKYLIKHPESSTTEVSEGLGIGLGNTSTYLNELKEKNLVDYEMGNNLNKPAEKKWKTEVDEIVFGFIKKRRIDFYLIIVIYSLLLAFTLFFLKMYPAMLISFTNASLVFLLRFYETKPISSH